MPAPLTHYGRDVTGRARFRSKLSVWKVLSLAPDPYKLVLQVEVVRRMQDVAFGYNDPIWIDAIESDLYPLRWYRKREGLEPLL